MSLHYNGEDSYLFLNGKEIIELKADNKSLNFPTRLCLNIISHGFMATDSREVSLNENVYDFSVDYNSIEESGMLNFHKYLMSKNNIIMFNLFIILLSFSSSLARDRKNTCLQMINHALLDLLLLI